MATLHVADVNLQVMAFLLQQFETLIACFKSKKQQQWLKNYHHRQSKKLNYNNSRTFYTILNHERLLILKSAPRAFSQISRAALHFDFSIPLNIITYFTVRYLFIVLNVRRTFVYCIFDIFLYIVFVRSLT